MGREIDLQTKTIWIGSEKVDSHTFKSYFTQPNLEDEPPVNRESGNPILQLRHQDGSIFTVDPKQTPVHAELTPPEVLTTDRVTQMTAYDIDSLSETEDELWIIPIPKILPTDQVYQHFIGKDETAGARKILNSTSEYLGSDIITYKTGLQLEASGVARIVVTSPDKAKEFDSAFLRTVIENPNQNNRIIILKGPQGKSLRGKYLFSDTQDQFFLGEHPAITKAKEIFRQG